MFNKFYFLHIPKTAGRYCKENIVVPLWEILINNGVGPFYGPSHANWNEPFITDSTFILSCFRDPIERTVSHYAHEHTLDQRGERKVPVGSSSEMTREKFMDWAKLNESYISNFQSKNFLENNPNFDHESKSDFCYYIEDEHIPLLMERVKRVNLFIKSISLDSSDIIKMQDYILNALGISEKPDRSRLISPTFFVNEDSQELYKMLTEEDKEYLKSLNEVDYLIFNDNSLFWNKEVQHD